jgi:hypothetical protein
MPNGSRTTNWIAVSLLLGALASTARAQDTTANEADLKPQTEGVRNRVTLVLQVSGLGQEGFEIEVRPAHPGCRFEPIVRTHEDPIPAGAVVRIDPIAIDATSLGADRDCSFAITIREPGKPPRTFLRGLRLDRATAEQTLPTQTFRCYLSATALALKDDASRKRR